MKKEQDHPAKSHTKKHSKLETRLAAGLPFQLGDNGNHFFEGKVICLPQIE